MNLLHLITLLLTTTYAQNNNASSTPNPTPYPTHNLIGSNTDLFIIPNVTLTYNEAIEYCKTRYFGLANVYDPSENAKILQLVNLNFITSAFIAYYKDTTDTAPEWKWQSNISSNPMLWLDSPLAPVSSNIEYPNTNCIYVNRYGWHYSTCDSSHYFVCETRDHRPTFIQNGPFLINTDRSLSFDSARSLCRAQHYDLATVYDENEYEIAQQMCQNYSFSANDSTNCWIGRERGIENVNEWIWVQDIPSSVEPINELINDNLWTVFPWQLSVSDVYCQATTNLTIFYSADGVNYATNTSGEFEINKAVHLQGTNVTYKSAFLFKVSVDPLSLPGLKCTVHFENDHYDTNAEDYKFWTIESLAGDGVKNGYDIVEAYSTVDILNTPPATISSEAMWLWNYHYHNKSFVKNYESITFKFSFANVKNVQNKPTDECAAISYFEPHKWKTNNCQTSNHFICNAYDHKPKFKVTDDGKFAILTDRTLTQKQSQSLCQEIYGFGLATIFSFYEFDSLNDLLAVNGVNSAWIGLHFDNETFVDSNNLDVNYGWQTQTNFIFDDWTLDIFDFTNDAHQKCVQQTDGKWQSADCEKQSYAICNVYDHKPNFTESQLGSFYLLDEAQNYDNGEQMCRDYVGIRSKSAIIYHPIENERAIWLCSNATNGKGCFIGYRNGLWSNGALIDVSESPWFGNPWLNETDSDLMMYATENDSYCTAIVQSDDGEWGWQIVDCDAKLNMLCDSGDDHSQCWMLQNCAQCALRSDCRWCGGQCQLTQEICYADELPIEQEFGCPDFDPIVNVTYHQQMNYSYYANITMCTQSAPDSVSTMHLKNYVNYSNCVVQEELMEFYVISDWQAAQYGNYDILGKMINLTQTTTNDDNDFYNLTTFEEAKVCDINIRHGYVQSITCEKEGVGFQNNVTQFQMLHDILRYLLPRLETRLFEGWDIPQSSLFGFSNMQRNYYQNDDNDHAIHRKFSKDSIIDGRYENATSDLLWEHRHFIEAGNTEIMHMNFSMIHVFAHIPHHNEDEKIQLFSFADCHLELRDKTNISKIVTDALKEDLYSLDEDELYTKNYTMDEWRGIRPNLFVIDYDDDNAEAERRRLRELALIEAEAENRRRLGIGAEIEKFCQKYNEITSYKGEEQFGIWGLDVWVSTIVNEINGGSSFLDIVADAAGWNAEHKKNTPLVIIPGFLELDLGFTSKFGFGWDWEKKIGERKPTNTSELSMKNCPISFQIADDLWSNGISKEARNIVMKCCAVYVDAMEDCDKTLVQAHAEANKCLKDAQFCEKAGSRPDSLLSTGPVFEWDEGKAPDLGSIIKMVMFFVNEGWEGIQDDITKAFELLLYDGLNQSCPITNNKYVEKVVDKAKGYLKSTTSNQGAKNLVLFAQTLGDIIQRAMYIARKTKVCQRKEGSGPVLFDFNIIFHFGFVNPTLHQFCKAIAPLPAKKGSEEEEERRRLLGYHASYPIIPEIPLPEIPIWPPWIMLKPALSVGTDFGVDVDPKFEEIKVGAELIPSAGFYVDASLSVSIGIMIISADITLGVKVDLVVIAFPFDIGVMLSNFGIYGDIKIDIKVLELTIYLKFQICFDFFFFSTCPISITLWSFNIVAYEYKQTLAQWGMGSHATRSALPANVEKATTSLRFYWGFKDAVYAHNGEYDYGWEENAFADFSDVGIWEDYILSISHCQIKEDGIQIVKSQLYELKDHPEMVNITDCKYNFYDFDKLIIFDIDVEWYSQLGMKTCFTHKTPQMFKDKFCCNFGLKVHDEIEKVSAMKFKLPSWQMIVVDKDETWSDKCSRFYINTEVQIESAPWYDDPGDIEYGCADEGWKLAHGKKDYHVGYHDIFGADELVHFNRKETCLNWYNSTLATKTLRTFEILYPYDFLMIGLRFWAKVSSKHTDAHWYGIRMVNATNYYWQSNVNLNCESTEDAYARWHGVSMQLDDFSDSTSYCYTDVLMYIDPQIDSTTKYKFDLEFVANIPDNEGWGFSHLVFNTFDNADICVNNINPVIELDTDYSNIDYDYYGLRRVPSLYYGYVLFDISFDYRFHDISALISLSIDGVNNGNSEHWVINFDDKKSGIWIRSGLGQVPSDGVLTLNEDLAATIVDTDSNEDRVYTKMYIQWNANQNANFMRVGFGHVLGENVLSSVKYDQFKFDTETPIKYIGFARSLGVSVIPSVYWKIYTNNLPSFCLSQIEDEKVHKAQNYKETCTEDIVTNTNLIIYDLVTPDCIYYTEVLSDPLKYTFTITEPHDYVLLNMQLFAQFDSVSTTPSGSCTLSSSGSLAVWYAFDGDHYKSIASGNYGDLFTFSMQSASHLSRVRFVATNQINCQLSINGKMYTTADSDMSSHWRIIKADQNGKNLVNTNGNLWNVNGGSSGGGYTVIFEFSFESVYGADYIDVVIEGQESNSNEIDPKWDPNLDREGCSNVDYFDGISTHLVTNCHGSLNATFEHLSHEKTFSILFHPHGVSRYGVADINLEYGLCRDVLPLIERTLRYNASYEYFDLTQVNSIADNYIFGMIKCELDSYESAESFISVGTSSESNPRFIVRFVDNMIQIWTSVNNENLFGETQIANITLNDTESIINNEEWFEFYIEWDKNEGFFRVGNGYVLGQNVLLSIDFYELYANTGVVIDAFGIMHANAESNRDFNIITFQFIPTNEPRLCWTSELENVAEKSWANTKMADLWQNTNEHAKSKRIPTELSMTNVFNGPFVSGDIISKSLTSIYEHDYVELNARIYGLGQWNVQYPESLNGLSVFFNDSLYDDSLVWFGTFLNNGGLTGIDCDISQYKQWSSWKEPAASNKELSFLNILSEDICAYDLKLYIKHNSTQEPFSLSFIGDMQQSKCNAIAQFDIALVESDNSDHTLAGYPKLFLKNESMTHQHCHTLCDKNIECKAWMYNVTGWCWLKSISDLNIQRKGGYISGICDGQNIYDSNSNCSSGESLIHYGFKSNPNNYLSKFTMYNYTTAFLDCMADNLVSISVSNDFGQTFEKLHFDGNETAEPSALGVLIENLTYTSRIKFDVINNGYMANNGLFYGFESADSAHYFMQQSEYDSNVILSEFGDAVPLLYQWQIIEPGLNGQSGTVSLKGHNDTYMTTNGDTSLQYLTSPSEQIRVVCVGDNELNVSFAPTGDDWLDEYKYYSFDDNSSTLALIEFNITNVLSVSKLRFTVTNNDNSHNNPAGLRCSIYSALAVISTSQDANFWSIESATKGNTSIEEVNWSKWPNYDDKIETNAGWIWNYDCSTENTSDICEGQTVVFDFSFENVPIYNYDMSTFKLTQNCGHSGYEDAFTLEGLGQYEDQFVFVNGSNVFLSELNETSSCWYIRSANPGGLGCVIDINNETFVTGAEYSYWSTVSSNGTVINTQNDDYMDGEFNFTQHDGAWIWNAQCLPMESTNCINDYSASFVFNLSEILIHPMADEYMPECKAKCEENEECDGWVYRYANESTLFPQCYLKSDLPIDLEPDNAFITGLNINANECDCICGDCYPGNQYHYALIKDREHFINPLYVGSTLYSHSCDFSLYEDESGNLTIKNLITGNKLKRISPFYLAQMEASKTWKYPVRMILDGPVLIIVDDEIENSHIITKQRTIQTNETDSTLGGLVLNSAHKIGTFYLPQEYSVQFMVEIEATVTHGMKIMTFGDPNTQISYFSFGWDNTNTTFVELNGTRYTVTDNSIKTLAKHRTHWNIKVSPTKLQIWATGSQKYGYQSFTLANATNATNSSSTETADDYKPILTTVYTIAPWHFGSESPANSQINIQEICISDLPYAQYLDNENEFDYDMRCWSGKYSNIDRKSEFISSFVSSSGCASVTSSCSTSFGEDLQYLPYYDALIENHYQSEDPSCFVGKFTEPQYPPIHNNLCVMLKKCQSPSQSLYTKAFGFSDVNISTSICQDVVANITKKVSVEWDDIFEIDYGSVQLHKSEVYTLNNNYLIFSLRPIRFPSQGFENRSVYISFMNVNDSAYGQEQSNLTWTLELNNEFGVKFYRGDRNVTERLIATKYVPNILEYEGNTIYADCNVNDGDDIAVYYAANGEDFVELETEINEYGMVTFMLSDDVSYVSKLRFLVNNKDDNEVGLMCNINVRGQMYATSANSAFWTIVNSTSGYNVISEYDQQMIWNYDCSSAGNSTYCFGQSVLFEFSFVNVNNPDNAPAFYVEWDSVFGDHFRFGKMNQSRNGIDYANNFDLILEVGYIANFYSYDIFYDGIHGFHEKISIEDVMFSIDNDTFNEETNWFMHIQIVNTTDPSACFGYDLLSDKATRITTRDLETFSFWTDDGKTNWKLNGNVLPGWHNVQYLNTTSNHSVDKKESFPNYFHFPFVANQQTWQRSFSIDDDINYDYVQIEFDIFTFCGWNHETDYVSASLAFEEYLHFSPFWKSTHTQNNCEGFNSASWTNVIDVVRMNNATHSDLSCYVQNMEDPIYECKLNVNTVSLAQKEHVSAFVDCWSYGDESVIVINDETTQYINVTQTNHLAVEINDVWRESTLKIDVNTNENSTYGGGLKCEIRVNGSLYFTNTSNAFWTVFSSDNNQSKDIVVRNYSDNLVNSEAVWIWNDDDTDNSILFEFSFFNVFIAEYALEYVNNDVVNISNTSNITALSFEATPLTSCNLNIESKDQNDFNLTIVDGDSFEYGLSNGPLITVEHIYINLEEFAYECRLDLYSDCNFDGNLTRIDALHTQMDIFANSSSWKFYAARGKECIATFYDLDSNESYTMNVEDGGMVINECNDDTTFSAVNISAIEAKYGCMTHVRFEAPNTNSQPFVLQIKANIEDDDESMSKMWAFSNLTITPLICSSFSNIVPLHSPIVLRQNGASKSFSSNELTSLSYEYLFVLIDFSDDYHFEFYTLIGGDANDYFFNVSISENDCFVENLKMQTKISCVDNVHYIDLVNNVSNSSAKPIIWMNWDPFNLDYNKKNFSVGYGSILHENVFATLNIFEYGVNESQTHSYFDFVTFLNPVHFAKQIRLLPIQFSIPKICLSELAEVNRMDVGNVWTDDCNERGWELQRKISIDSRFDSISSVGDDDGESIETCQITQLGTNPITKIASDCFHGPFNDEYISRYFHVFTDIDYDIISVSLTYYSLCSWNPEKSENDTAYVFINDIAEWRSSPAYEFVNEYCEGYDLYSDWSLDFEYADTLNSDLIQCLNLLDQICAYPVTLQFRTKFEKNEIYFKVGIGAALNQVLENEAFGFGNVSIAYSQCPILSALPIGSIRYQPLQQLTSAVFGEGDLLVISSESKYYVVVDKHCYFTLFGGYKMWSQKSSNCTVAGLPILANISNADDYELGLLNDGGISFQNKATEKRLFTRRTACDIDAAYYYYSMNVSQGLGYFGGASVDDNILMSIDCEWALVISKAGPLRALSNVVQSDDNNDGIVGDIQWSKGNNVAQLMFSAINGSLILSDYGIDGNQINTNMGNGDFMIFDSGKLALFDFESNALTKEYSFEHAQCKFDGGVIKYFYFMKAGDILWNGEALISVNCEFKLILKDGYLMIYDANNTAIWTVGEGKGERFEFLKNGDLALYSYFDEDEILWQSNTSTLLSSDSINYADRAILYDDGQLFVIDNATLSVKFTLFSNLTQTNLVKNEYNFNYLCNSEKYSFVDKRYGFYATFISYFNCIENEYRFNKTTPCILYKYCPIVQEYETLLLEPSGAQTNCREYSSKWMKLANDYILFQASFTKTDSSSQPKLSILLSENESNDIEFGNEFDEKFEDRKMLISVSPKTQSVTLSTRYFEQTFYFSHLFNDSLVGWFWMDWDINFDRIRMGNSKFISAATHQTQFSKFFVDRSQKLDRNENLFNFLNYGWSEETTDCYGTVIVQFPPLSNKIPKGCHEEFNYTLIEPTVAPTREPTLFITTNDIGNDDGKSKMSAGSIVGIVIGCLSFVALIVAISIFVVRKRRDTEGGIVEKAYDVKIIDTGYVRMEDQDSAL